MKGRATLITLNLALSSTGALAAQDTADTNRSDDLPGEDTARVLDLTFNGPIRFTGVWNDVKDITFGQPIEFTAGVENDLGPLPDYLQQIRDVDAVFDDWVTTWSFREALLAQQDNPSWSSNQALIDWLDEQLEWTFYAFNTQLELQERNQRHIQALERAISDLRYHPDQGYVEDSIAYFNQSMPNWTERYADIQSRYYDCLMPLMYETWQLDLEAQRVFQSPEWSTRYDGAFAAYEAKRAEARSCVSEATLDPITQEPVFEWPVQD